MKLKLFFSHAWADKAGAKVKNLLLLLQKNYDVWLDKKQIDVGNHINNTVAEGIAACDIFVSVWSSKAHKSKGVQFELEAAAKLNKPVLVLLIENYSIENSPYLSGKEYIDFSGNELSFAQQEVYLGNFLLRKQLDKYQQHFANDPCKKEALADIAKQTTALQDTLIQLEDNIHRNKIKASGNDDSDVYIQSSLTAFDNLHIIDEEEGNLMQRFSAKMKEISAKYPLQQDDKIKKRLALKAIEELDPKSTNKNLNSLKNAFQQDLGMVQTENASIITPKVSQEQLEHLIAAYKLHVDKAGQEALAQASSFIDKIPFLNILSSFSKASTEYENSYITNSPEILNKMYLAALNSQNSELQGLVTILIKHINEEDLKKVSQTKKINAFMPYAYLINNTARLLVKVNALKEEDVSYSMVSSLGLDKISTFFFKDDWKQKTENFLETITSNYGIKDNNLKWLKTAAAIIGVVLVADSLDGFGGGDAGTVTAASTSSAAGSPIYFEDKMAAMGFSMPS